PGASGSPPAAGRGRLVLPRADGGTVPAVFAGGAPGPPGRAPAAGGVPARRHGVAVAHVRGEHRGGVPARVLRDAAAGTAAAVELRGGPARPPGMGGAVPR